MNTLSRKQREIAARHALFLDLGRRLIVSEGYPTLTMERIAELAEYSKGTVYQHFSCKEEVLIQLCNHNALRLKKLFQRASTFEGTTRERLLAIFLAHSIWAKLDPICADMMQTLCSAGVKAKVDEESLETHNRLEMEIIGMVSSIVEDAIKEKELQLPNNVTPVELVFSLWATCHGGLILQNLDLPLEAMGVRDPANVLLLTSQATLDGFSWKPLSTELDYSRSLKRIIKDCFEEECLKARISFTL